MDLKLDMYNHLDTFELFKKFPAIDLDTGCIVNLSCFDMFLTEVYEGVVGISLDLD